MSKIKVLLANQAQMPRELMAELTLGQPEMDVKGEVLDPIEILLAVGEYPVDVVVLDLSDPGQEPGICSHLLAEYPDLLVLALAPDLGEGFLYRRTLEKQQLAEVSKAEILAAIRKAGV